MESRNTVELSLDEQMAINGGGFWKELLEAAGVIDAAVDFFKGFSKGLSDNTKPAPFFK